MSFKFENLKIWKESVEFASEVYALTRKFPKGEQFGLISQLNRAAVSVSLNIAEGEGRNSDADLSRFIHIAIGSINETVTILCIAFDQKYITKSEYDAFYKRCEHISKMLHSFRNYLKTHKPRSINHRPSTTNHRPSTIDYRPHNLPRIN